MGVQLPAERQPAGQGCLAGSKAGDQTGRISHGRKPHLHRPAHRCGEFRRDPIGHQQPIADGFSLAIGKHQGGNIGKTGQYQFAGSGGPLHGPLGKGSGRAGSQQPQGSQGQAQLTPATPRQPARSRGWGACANGLFRHPASIQTGAIMNRAGVGSAGPVPNLKFQLSLSKRMLRSSQGLRVIGALVEIRSMPLAA